MKAVITRFFRSVAGKVFCVLTVCILALLLINWLLNTFAFAKLYEREKETLLTSAYTDANDAIARRADLSGALSVYHTEHDMSILIWSQHQVLYATDRPIGPIILPSTHHPSLASGSYIIQNRSDTDGDSMVLYGKTREGIYVTLHLPILDKQANSALTNRFLWWATLVTLILSCAVVFVLARIFTRPVRRLSNMAGRMAHLDFSDRYVGEGQDELAELGRSLNTVSETMEQNLSELKTANARLQRDMELTKNQNEARTRFIRNVSHELKTPISLIQTYAEGLHENIAADTADREFYCSVIEDEATKLSQIIAKLTTLMQLESGGDELTIERFDLSALLIRLLQRHAPVFAERAVPLPTLSEEPLFVWGDALLIEQVFTNYLTNALHHVTEGGEIRIELQPTADKAVRITVFNTGTPIPDEDLPHIWESFYKIDKARTRAYGGTGIGLSVVAAIMQAHRMPYGVNNRPDGVEFWIDLQL